MREITSLNSGWTFICEGKEEKINLPHTWNALDGQSGENGYKRIKCIYTRTLPAIDTEKCILNFDGVNSVCEVFIDNVKIGTHKGGYSHFRFDITDYVNKETKLTVTADNSDKADVYPSMADFTFWGGIYRGVSLITTGKCCFSSRDYSSDGCYVTPFKKDGEWKLGVKSLIESPANGAKVIYTLFDKDGCEAAKAEKDISSPSAVLSCPEPVLWQGRKNPYLYTLNAKIILADGSVSDELNIKTAFREFIIDCDKGAFLNGEHIKLRGLCRHQDRENKGNALTEKEHREDIEIICETGANALRLAHYQQADEFYSLCDEKGLLVWAEIPVISRFSAKKQANARQQLAELIKQNYNHPCIFCWGIENEITISSAANGKLKESLTELNSIVKKLDSTRYSTCAQVSMLAADSPLNSITDILGYNHYYGWYCDSCDGIARWLDSFKKLCPQKRLCLSEYGAEAVLNWQSEKPEQGDYSEQYQCLFHERYLEEINARDWLWGSFLWNTFDFGSAVRSEGGTRGRNNKGLVTFDRKTKKDAFYLYKASWSDEPFVHICSKRFVNRKTGTTEIKVYSNLPEITLRFGSHSCTKKGKTVFVFSDVPVEEGENIYCAVCGEYEDSITVNGVLDEDLSYRLPDDKRSFVRNWFPDGESLEDRLSVNDKIGDVLKSEEAKTIIRTQLGSKADLLWSPLAAPLKPLKINTLLNAAKKFGLSEDMAGLANGFLQTIKK